MTWVDRGVTLVCVFLPIISGKLGREVLDEGVKLGKAALKNADEVIESTRKVTKQPFEIDLQLFANKGTGKAGFKTQELLDSHFEKHAAEFGNITKEQYLKGAQDLVSSKPGGNILTKTRSNGDILFYNKANNEFAVKASDGTIRTYFKPTDGVDYFYRQK